MSDPYARRTPYEVVFGAESIDDRLFPPIAEEAEARDQPLIDPERFLFLSSVGHLLRRIAGQEPYADAETAGDEAAGEAVGEEAATAASDEAGEEMRQYGRLLYHAFHFWRGGKALFTTDEALCRHVVEEVTSVGDWSFDAPHPSGYLQLPRHLFWAAPAPGETPEPADGFFWTVSGGESEPVTVRVLVTLGIRPDRPGFSVVPAEGVLDDEAHWAESDGRPDGADFESSLPGGEMDALYSIETATEVLKLASRLFWHISAYPESLGAEERADDDAAPEDPRRMPPTELSYRPLRLP